MTEHFDIAAPCNGFEGEVLQAVRALFETHPQGVGLIPLEKAAEFYHAKLRVHVRVEVIEEAK